MAELEKKATGELDTPEPDLIEDDNSDMEPLVTSKDDLWAEEDATGEDIIIPQQSQSLNLHKGRKLKNINRSDNFRRLIRRKSSKDKPSDTSDLKRNSLRSEINDNNFNETLENNNHHGTLLTEDSVDSIDGNSVSLDKYLDGDIKILHHMTLYPTAEETEGDNVSQLSEASSTNTENGINDSITNMELLRGYLYSFTVTCLTFIWGYIESGIGYVYRHYLGGDENEAGIGKTDDGEDEADTKPKELTEKDRRRLFNICNELLTTERAYVKRLAILVQIKTKTSEIIQADVARAMFQNIEVIHMFHQDNLLPQLEKRILEWEDHRKIGDIMRKLAPFLKLYTEYVKNFGAANELFETWKQKSATFANFVKEAENSAEYGRLKVQAHMLEPVQRVPRYELLLKDYLKTLPHESEDKDDSEQALQLVSNAAKHFEEMMKRDTRIQELMQLKTQFEGPIDFVSADRELLHTGKVKLVNIKAGKISERVLHLFTDLLLVSSEEKYILPGMPDKFRVRHSFNLDQTKLAYGNNLEIPYTFYVKSPEIIVELSASSLEERKVWLDKISKQINTCDNGETSNIDHQGFNETSVAEGFLKQRCTFQLSSDNKTWKKRCFSLYDNGLLGVTRNSNDRQTLAAVHVANFQTGLKHSQQKKGVIIVLVGENKVYQLYDENSDIVESWFKAIKNLSESYPHEEEYNIDDWTSVLDNKNRMSTVSNLSGDSGIDTVSLSSQASNVSNQST